MSIGWPGQARKPLRVTKATEFADEKNLSKNFHCPLGKHLTHSRHPPNMKRKKTIHTFQGAKFETR